MFDFIKTLYEDVLVEFGVRESKKWKKQKGRLHVLKDDLDRLGNIKDAKDPFDYSLKFFNIISQFYDVGLICDVPKKGLLVCDELNNYLFRCGRDKYGHNRTSKGQEVCLCNTWWGNIFGLKSKQASFWKSNKNIFHGFSQKYPNLYDEDPRMMDVIADQQIIPYITSSKNIIMILIEQLLTI